MDIQIMTDGELIDRLLAESLEARKEAICELRLRSKGDADARSCIAEAGAIPVIGEYLMSSDSIMQENAVTCLLNLSISLQGKREIMANSRCLDAIIEAVTLGKTSETKQNAAATLFSLLIVEEFRDYVGSKKPVIPALLALLQSDLIRSQKDALKALFHLCLCKENKPRAVHSGAVPLLISIVTNREKSVNNNKEGTSNGTAEDALAVLGLLAACSEGVTALMKVDAVPLLVELLEPQEFHRCRENATAALFVLCQTGGDPVLQAVLKCSFAISALCGVLSSGSSRARSKAGSLLQLLMVNDRS